MTLDRLTAALADRYTLDRELGAGGMATVYLAQDLKHDRQVAIKVLRPELAAVIGAERFLSEIKTTANLQHPHILPLHDSGQADSFLYYVMPFVEGETLRDRIAREKQLPITDAVRIASEVASALDYAHRHGVIHRDIKPENILLHDGQALVADFGIALAATSAGARMTETGMSLGTPHYMSPEQAMGERELDARTDVYALGAVLYECLTGDPPFIGSTAQAIVAKVMTEKPTPPSRTRDTVPEVVEDAVLAALQKLAADRPASAAEFAAGLSGSPTIGTTHRRAAATVTRQDRRLLMALGATALAGVAFGIWGLSRADRSPTPTMGWAVDLAVPDSTAPRGQVSLSRAGDILVYSGMTRDGRQLFARRANDPTPRLIPGTVDGSNPSLSPNGDRLLFSRWSAGGTYVIPTEGGTPRLVSDSTPFTDQPAWINEDSIVISTLAGLAVVSVSNQATTRLTRVDRDGGEMFHFGADVLPDRAGVVFNVSMADGSELIAVLPTGEEQHRILGPGTMARHSPTGHLLVLRSAGRIEAVPFELASLSIVGQPVTIVDGITPGRRSAAGNFSIAGSGRLVYANTPAERRFSEVVLVDESGDRSPIRDGIIGDFTEVRISPDATRLAMTAHTNTAEEVHLLDLTTGARNSFGRSADQSRSPAFSPDGKDLWYVGLGSILGIYRVSAIDPMEPLLVHSNPFYAARDLSISRDGGRLHFTRFNAGFSDLMVLDLTSDSAPPDTLLATSAVENGGILSPDGNWILYHSGTQDDRAAFVRSSDPRRSGEWQISSPGQVVVGFPRWAPAGNRIYYATSDSLHAAPVSTGTSFTQTGTPRALFPLGTLLHSFDVHPRGGFVMIDRRPGADNATLTMIENWTTRLPQ